MNLHKESDKNQVVTHGAVASIGDSHIRFPIGLQDSNFCINQDGVFVGVICDGCSLADGSYTENQLGAILGAEIIARYVHKQLRHRKRRRKADFRLALDIAATKSYGFFRQFLTSIETRRLQVERAEFVKKKLLFTVIGVIIIDRCYCVFGCGDGYFGKNIDFQEVEKTSTRMNYLQSVLTDEESKGLAIYRTGKMRPNEVLWIASDGLGDLFKKENWETPFETFLRDEKTCAWEDGEDKTRQPFRVLLNRFTSKFSDDISLVVVKTK